ncbi:armadillo-type protein [Obelidium mucronatum]|nr:armadillo-type protein [Obelidium mucronatum]
MDKQKLNQVAELLETNRVAPTHLSALLSPLFDVLAGETPPQTKEVAVPLSCSCPFFKDVLIAVPLLLEHGGIPSTLIAKPAKPVPLSDEFKTDAIKSLMAVLKQSRLITPEAVALVAVKKETKWVPYYAHAITCIIDAFLPSKDKLLQTVCLDVLFAICGLLDPQNTAKVLPGIVSNLVVFIDSAGEKIASSVLVKALTASFCHRVTSTVTSRMAQVVQKLLLPLKKTQRHPSYKVRLAYLEYSAALLANCYERLAVDETITRCLLQCVAGFIEDETEQVRTRCLELFADIAAKDLERAEIDSTDQRVQKLTDLMLQCLFNLMREEIPRALSGLDWDLKVDLLRLCCGYLICAGKNHETAERLREFHFTTEAVDVFLESVMTTVVFENSNVKVIEDRDIGKSTAISFGSDSTTQRQESQSSAWGAVTKFLDSNQPNDVVIGVSRVFKLLAQYANGQLIFNRLVAFFEDPSAHASNNTCLLLDGLAIASTRLGAGFTPFLIDALYPVIEKCGDTNKMVSQTASHALQSIAYACSYSGGVKPLLIGNIDYIVNDLSMRLRYLAEFPNAPKVLVAVLDVAGKEILPYLDDSFEDILMAIDFNQDSGDGDSGNIDLLETVFVALERLTTVLLNARGLGDEIFRSVQPSRLEAPPDSVTELEESGVSKDMSAFQKKFEARAMRNRRLDEEAEEVFQRNPSKPFESTSTSSSPEEKLQTDEEVMEEAHTDEDDGNPKLTTSEQMAQKILTKSQHFLARDKDPHLQSLLLRLCAKSVRLLVHKPNTMNPLVHVLWPTVIRLLGNTAYHFVILDALLLISAFASVSKGFICKRFVQDLLPKLETVLATFSFRPSTTPNKRSALVKSVMTAETGLNDEHSVVFRIVVNCLDTLANIVASIPVLQIPELVRVTQCAWPFLEDRQHEKLRKAARDVILVVGDKDANDIWIRAHATLNSRFTVGSTLVTDTESVIIGAKRSEKLKQLVFPKFFRDKMGGGGVFTRSLETICIQLF